VVGEKDFLGSKSKGEVTMARRELDWKSRPNWANITVKENMSSDVVSVGPETCLRDIAKLMRDGGVGCVPIKENGKVIGIVTDRDITCRVTASSRDPGTTTAKAIMTGDVGCCFEDDLLSKAAGIMVEKQVRRLPVLNRNEELVGLLTADDLSWHTDKMLLGRVIESVSEAHA
jgi:CBS domain-containing protein